MPPRNLLHSTRDSHKFIIERAAKLTTALGVIFRPRAASAPGPFTPQQRTYAPRGKQHK